MVAASRLHGTATSLGLKFYCKKKQKKTTTTTTMTIKKATPPIKGYDIKRRDREQLKGKENNRGGGLLFGIKEIIPSTEMKNEMRGPGDNITEWHTVEIPTGKKNKIRITNMYIPPIR